MDYSYRTALNQDFTIFWAIDFHLKNVNISIVESVGRRFYRGYFIMVNNEL